MRIGSLGGSAFLLCGLLVSPGSCQQESSDADSETANGAGLSAHPAIAYELPDILQPLDIVRPALPEDAAKQVGERDAKLAELEQRGLTADHKEDQDAALREAIHLAKQILAIRVEHQGNTSEQVRWRNEAGEPIEWYEVTDARLKLDHYQLLLELDTKSRTQIASLSDTDKEVERLFHSGKYGQAIPVLQQQLNVRRRVLGSHHPDTMATLGSLGMMFWENRQWPEAEPLMLDALDNQRRLLGTQHPDALFSIANMGLVLRQFGRLSEAEPYYREALLSRRRVLGDTHPDTIISVSNFGVLLGSQGKYTEAEPFYRYALKFCRKLYSDDHAYTARAISNLGYLLERQGNFSEAAQHYRESLKLRERLFGTEHSEYLDNLSNLGTLYLTMGDYASAEPLLQRVLEITGRLEGEEHRDFASSLHNLALLYSLMGDDMRAMPLEKRALEIKRKALGEEHPSFAYSLQGLAGIHRRIGNFATAKPLYEQALEIRRTALGESHPRYAESLNNLGLLYKDMGDNARAEALLQQSLEVTGRVQGEHHPLYATSLSNLASLCSSVGDFERAEELYNQAKRIRGTVLGKEHPNYALTCLQLCRLHENLGNPARAQALIDQAVSIFQQFANRTAVVQSEHQQLISSQQLTAYIDAYISLATRREDAVSGMYHSHWQSKGSVLLRQQSARQLLASDDPGLQRLRVQLQRTATQLANVSAQVPADTDQLADWRDRVEQLVGERERVEKELSARSADYRRALRRAASTPVETISRLPSDCVLLDFREYTHSEPKAEQPGQWKTERRYVAFVSRNGQPVQLVELGAADRINQLVETGRAIRWKPAAGEAFDSPERSLRRLLWEPLAPYLEGVTTVLISPDSMLSMVPWGALPGNEPDTFLVEQYAFAAVPVPQMLADQLDSAAAERSPEARLMLVGDVAYGAQPGEVAALTRGVPRGRNGREPWKPLSGARAEVLTIRDTFETCFSDGQVDFLRRDQATENRLRSAVPGQSWLHLATHGFFAPEQVKSAASPESDQRPAGSEIWNRSDLAPVAGFHPGVLSGIVLAGANREPELGQNDGILTALEVMDLDLRAAELVTMSACETALGKIAGGEGILGLQRAIQMAGAKTSVASLWKVRDTAAQRLMVQFYENLWDKRMGKLEALRAAQLSMLREARRGGEDEFADSDGPTDGVFRAPEFWAAWVLSGDWR